MDTDTYIKVVGCKISDVYFSNEIAIDVAQTSPRTSLQVM